MHSHARLERNKFNVRGALPSAILSAQAALALPPTLVNNMVSITHAKLGMATDMRIPPGQRHRHRFKRV